MSGPRTTSLADSAEGESHMVELRGSFHEELDAVRDLIVTLAAHVTEAIPHIDIKRLLNCLYIIYTHVYIYYIGNTE